MGGISLLRRDHFKPDVVWGVLGKGMQSNAKYGLVDLLEVHYDHVMMPDGYGKRAEKTKGRSLDVMSAIKKSIVSVKEGMNCLVYALFIAISRVNGDPKYASYRDGRGLRKLIEGILKASGINLPNARRFDKLRQFQVHFSE